jgi:hypothetical protein
MPPVPKPQRIRDEKLLAEVRRAGCCVRRCSLGAEAAHVKSKGSGGDDLPENVSPLCHWHHAEQHTIGWKKFREKYPEVRTWAEITGAA